MECMGIRQADADMGEMHMGSDPEPERTHVPPQVTASPRSSNHCQCRTASTIENVSSVQ